MIYLYKILRWSAWLLVLATLLTLLSGFTMTKYFLFPGIGYGFSYYVHTIIIPLFFVPLFYIHSLTGLFSLMMRHKFLNHKYLKIIFGLVWTGFFVLFGWFYLAKNPLSSGIGNGVSNSNNQVVGAGNISLTVDEVGRHNSVGDCWLIIDGSVYDVTNYLGVHPGGAYTITPYCGKDGSQAFATKDIGTPHSPSAASILKSFYLGRLGETITGATVQNVQGQPVPSSGDEAEDDD